MVTLIPTSMSIFYKYDLTSRFILITIINVTNDMLNNIVTTFVNKHYEYLIKTYSTHSHFVLSHVCDLSFRRQSVCIVNSNVILVKTTKSNVGS